MVAHDVESLLCLSTKLCLVDGVIAGSLAWHGRSFTVLHTFRSMQCNGSIEMDHLARTS